MKSTRYIAIAPLALISLMNLGTLLEPDQPVGLSAFALIVGVAGFVAAFGLARNAPWGVPAALAVSGVNVLAAIAGLVADIEGAIIGLVVSAVALGLALAAGSAQRRIAVA